MFYTASAMNDSMGSKYVGLAHMKMEEKKQDNPEISPVELPEAERKKKRYKDSRGRKLRSVLFPLLAVVFAAVIAAALLLPVLQISGTSMTETLDDGDIVVAMNNSRFEKGDVIAFRFNDMILVKRVIANPGEWVNIDQEGNVFVNNNKLEEPYLKEKAFGETNIELPYQVPEGKIFVMGDNRSVSIDSRNTSIGCISEEQIVGKIVYRVWPFSQFGTVH